MTNNHRMRISGWVPTLALCAFCLKPAAVQAATPTGSPLATTTGQHRQRHIDPLLREGAPAVSAERLLPALLRLPDYTERSRTELESRGVHFRLAPNGMPRRLGDVYPVDAPRSVLATLANSGLKIHVGRSHVVEDTTRHTGSETEAFDLWGVGPTPTQGPAGHGPTIAIVEHGMDIFHPHFFRADGGAWPWVDVDGDGALTPGVDGVDTDLDGQIADFEVLQLLDYGWARPGPGPGGFNGTFDTAWDYLYVDLNGDGDLDQGPGAGYTEDSPGYGEPMFVPDDANGDLLLSEDERILMLKTSQIKGIRAGGETWTRGDNLIETTLAGGQSAVHGTAVGGILTGGQTLAFRGNRGLVPNAELVVVSLLAPFGQEIDDTTFAENMSWAVHDMGAEVANHSWGVSSGLHMDGSNVFDTVVDGLTAEGVVQACAAGNRGISGMHREVATSDVGEFDVVVPGNVAGWSINQFTLDVHLASTEAEIECTLRHPNGETHTIEEVTDGSFGDLVLDTVRTDSERGWAMLSVSIQHAQNGHVGSGIWEVDCEHDTGRQMPMHGFVFDPITGAGPGGVEFVEPTNTGTMPSPATSDSCIAVGAYSLEYPPAGSTSGQLEGWSSRGPRIDGGETVGVTAPMDPVAAFVLSSSYGRNGYAVFGGTSGASPHVAAVAALLKGADPARAPAEIREMIFAGAVVDEQVDVDQTPDDGWGHGKLRGYQALGEGPPAPRPQPDAIGLNVTYSYDDGDCAALLEVTGADWGNASFRWDEEYDGAWDTDFESDPTYALLLSSDAAAFHVRVDAAERGWIIGGLTLVGEAPEDCFDEPPPGSDSSGDGSGDGSTGGSSGTQGEDEGSDSPGSAASDEGCGCRQRSPHGAQLLLWLLAIVLARRRTAG